MCLFPAPFPCRKFRESSSGTQTYPQLCHLLHSWQAISSLRLHRSSGTDPSSLSTNRMKAKEKEEEEEERREWGEFTASNQASSQCQNHSTPNMKKAEHNHLLLVPRCDDTLRFLRTQKSRATSIGHNRKKRQRQQIAEECRREQNERECSNALR